MYNQFSHAVLNVVTKKSREYFGYQCIAYATKLEFQERNTPHHHLLLWLDCGILEDIDEVDRLISAELPRPGENDELRRLIKKFMVHRDSPYCRRPIIPPTHLDKSVKKVVYRRSEQEDLNVVAYNARLMQEFSAHITLSDPAVAVLWHTS